MIDKAILKEELEKTTYFKRALRSSTVMSVDHSVVAAVMDEELDLEDVLDLDEPPLGFGG